MASTIQAPSYIEYNSGDGIIARRSGNVVTVRVRKSASGSSGSWASLGTLPSEYIPTVGNVDFTGFDNNASTYSANSVVDLRISTSGAVSVYLFSDKTSLQAVGNVTYIV